MPKITERRDLADFEKNFAYEYICECGATVTLYQPEPITRAVKCFNCQESISDFFKRNKVEFKKKKVENEKRESDTNRDSQLPF